MARPRGTDLARWLAWGHLRQMLDPRDRSALLAASTVASRALWHGRRHDRPALLEDLQQCFPKACPTVAAAKRVARSGVDLEVQCRVEELVAGRLTQESVESFLRIEGRLPPRSPSRRTLVLVPHAGAIVLGVAALALTDGAVTWWADEDGLGEPQRRLARTAAAARRAEQAGLPVHIIRDDDPWRRLGTALSRGDLVVAAFDVPPRGEAWALPFLGRPARLDPRPWELAVETGADVLPALVVRQVDRRHRLCLGRPIPAAGRNAQDLCRQALMEAFEPALRKRPETYAAWLARCRHRAEAGGPAAFSQHR